MSAGYFTRRLLQTIPVVVGVTMVVFLLVHLTPGDPAKSLLGQHATPAAVEQLRHRLALDQPLPAQYADFMGRLARGDLGTSFRYDEPALSLIYGRLGPTLLLLAMAALFSVLIAVPAALLAATRPGGGRDQLVRIIPLVGLGMPAFWVGIVLLLVVGLQLGWLPAGGYGVGLRGHLVSLILPALTVALSLAPLLIRSLRASLLEVLRADYITTARAKGITERRVMVRHALRNGLIPMVTILSVNIGFLVGGTVVVERVFALPGLGTLMIDSIINRDFPVVQGITLVFALLVVAINLLSDAVYALLDPRVRLA